MYTIPMMLFWDVSSAFIVTGILIYWISFKDWRVWTCQMIIVPSKDEEAHWDSFCYSVIKIEVIGPECTF